MIIDTIVHAQIPVFPRLSNILCLQTLAGSDILYISFTANSEAHNYMSPPLKNYLKTHRKLAGLSQNDVAFLLGKESGTYVSKTEQSKVNPDICTALFYQIIFNIPVEDLFAGVKKEVELQTITRVKKLINRLEKRGRSPKILRRIDYFEKVVKRITESKKMEL